MILPDANVLIHAHNSLSPRHEAARRWWEETLRGSEFVALTWTTMMAFIRITTNRRIFTNPLTVGEALERVEDWLAEPNVRVVDPGQRHAELFFGLLREVGTAANLTTDAHLAAIAMERTCVVHTTDTDFARFRGVRWANPLES